MKQKQKSTQKNIIMKPLNNFILQEQSSAITAQEETKNQITELKTKKIPQLERKIASIRGCHSVDAKKLNARIEQVERLKKENVGVREELTQAKEIIRNLLRVTYGEGWNYSLGVKAYAEQFLRGGQ